ncbi:MAG: amidohydrolase [Actinobacteria bacterium]|nr:MAG: amidohydrolase [Actinomycetota bacterium]
MIYAAKWVLPVTGSPVEDGAVAVKENKICDVGKLEALTDKYPEAEVKDFGLAAIMPGFIDAHTHLEFSVFRGIVDDLPFSYWKIQLANKAKKLSDEDWQASADIGAMEAVKSGITTIADTSTEGYSLNSAKKYGLRGFIFAEVTGLNPADVSKIMSKTKKRVGDWQSKVSGTKLNIGISPYSTYTVSPPLYKAVNEYARENNLLLSTHVAGTKDEYEFVKYASGPLATKFKKIAGFDDVLWQPTGASPVKYLEQWDGFEGNVIAVHCVHVNAMDLDILAKYNVKVVHCPRVSAKLGMGIAPLKGLAQRKLKIGLGSDSPASNNTVDLFEEMRVGLYLQRGLNHTSEGFSAEEFIKMATIGGAEVLGLESEIGSLEPQKQADIIAIDLSRSYQIPTRDPYSAIVYGANQANVVFTMCGGQVLYDREHSFIDETQAKVEKARSKLRE